MSTTEDSLQDLLKALTLQEQPQPEQAPRRGTRERKQTVRYIPVLPSSTVTPTAPDLLEEESEDEKSETMVAKKKGPKVLTKAELNKQLTLFYEKPMKKEAKKKRAPPVPKELLFEHMEPHLPCEDALKTVYKDQPRVLSPESLQKTLQKAYYLGGPAGAGKSMVYKTLFSSVPLNNYYYYNVDNYYEAYLQLNGLLMKTNEYRKRTKIYEQILETLQTTVLPFKQEGDKELFTKFLSKRVVTSIKSILMGRAQQCIREDMEKVSQMNPTLVIDKPAAKFDIIQKELYNPLQKKGYTQYMIFVYTPLFTALANNRRRGGEEASGRTLADHIIIDSWVHSMQNIENLKKLFGENIFFVDNSLGTTMETYDPTEIRAKLDAEKYYLSEEDLNTWLPLISKTEDAISSLTFTDIDTIKSKLGL